MDAKDKRIAEPETLLKTALQESVTFNERIVPLETEAVTQIELIEKPFFVTEYHQLIDWCKHCQCWHDHKLPPEVEKAGFFGPNMIALTACLKGHCHVSYRTLKKYFHDCMGITA